MSDLIVRRGQYELTQLAAALNNRRTLSVDVVAPAQAVRFEDGQLVLSGMDPMLNEDGTTDVNGRYTPTVVGDETLAARLDIPARYLKRLRRESRFDLYDENVNGWLNWVQTDVTEDGVHEYGRSGEKSLYRLLRADVANDQAGVLRAVLSPRYRTIDDFDVLLAMLKGLGNTGLEIGPNDITADLTPRRMIVRVRAPQVQAMAPRLLAGYRSPFTAQSGDALPVVFAGFRMTNSEVGGGAFQITPELTVQICTNGMTMTADATREIHLGGELPDGIQWSDATRRKNIDLVSSKTTDVVEHFLSKEYVTGAVTRLEAQAGVELTKPEETIRAVAKDRQILFSDTEAEGILGMFVRGGQMTSGGVLQAITSFSQTVPDADRAHEIETRAVRAMSIAARVGAQA
jgi:hypothetical protein